MSQVMDNMTCGNGKILREHVGTNKEVIGLIVT